MNLIDVFGDFEYIYNFGPSSLGDGIIDVKSLQDWVTKNYVKTNYRKFDDTIQDYLIFNRNRFFSGKIYSFKYDGKGPDMQPMFMSITNIIEKADRLSEIGLNLNYMNPKERLRLFKGIIKLFPNQVRDNIEKIKEGARNPTDLPFIHKEYRKKFFDAIDLKPSFMKIDRSTIMRDSIKEVNYEHWKYLIYYLPTTFVNKNPAEMYKEKG